MGIYLPFDDDADGRARRMFLASAACAFAYPVIIVAAVLFTAPQSRLRPAAVALVAAVSWASAHSLWSWQRNMAIGNIASAVTVAIFFNAFDAVLNTRVTRADIIDIVRHKRKRRQTGTLEEKANGRGWERENGGGGGGGGGGGEKRLEKAVSTSTTTISKSSTGNSGASTVTEEVSLFAQVLTTCLTLVVNVRRIGTKWQVKGVPAPYSYGGAGASRARFLARAGLRTLLLYAVLEILGTVPLPPDLDMVSQARVPLLSRLSHVTAEELVFRAVLTFGIAGTAAACIACGSGLVEIAGVAMGVYDPQDCRPIFGPLADMWSVRKAWGSVWHQMVRGSISGTANYLTDEVLGLPHGGPRLTRLSRRYATVALVFLLSGLMHHLCDVQFGMPPAEYGFVAFFLWQPVGIALEDCAASLYRQVAGSSSSSSSSGRLLPAAAEYAVGYAWTVAWFVWTVPFFGYAQARWMIKPRDDFSFGLLAKALNG